MLKLLGPNWASPNGSAGECPKQEADWETVGLLLDKPKLNFSIPCESHKVGFCLQGLLVPGQYRQLVSAQSPHPNDCQYKVGLLFCHFVAPTYPPTHPGIVLEV